ncbi:MAG: hypothetical protein A3J62_01825 [Candidatus Buchananbacteria bacterium RIFCSPHIGHO2_02_FULL_38_8]|uniref:Colicin V production protein n=1 Tax=Candidatus Buchananbacteria bacterium RIFCSPHIGHO2_02_FULL_38_8 TaxID=1797538 RepID=A0A1G1Y479_9BACT|nr:hypothetical protein [uncultured bacterium]OGY47143.1 MAG: hypothetical protein A3J62_01825 [Candidatus Buchananbacteria bacterium RIFCSPHIGHO2_02_FULL_38_8]
MYLTIFDLILLLILFLFIAFGFALGLIQTFGALVGLVLGAWVAGMYYEQLASFLAPFLLNNFVLADIVSFIIIFTLISRLTGLVFHIINKIFNIISFIPFTKSLNRLLGALFGFIEGVLALGLILYFISKFDISEWFTGVLAGSKIALWLIKMAGILTPLLPELIRSVQSVI